MNTDDRITLAEAMGWTQITKRRLASRSLNKRWLTGRSPDQKTERWGVKQIPDPENDANDDYAVLEWINSHTSFSFREPYWNAMTHRIWSYKIGDYARAALKVIGEGT